MWAKLLLLFFVFSFLFRTDLSFNQDLGRHIKLGEIIVNTLNVPRVNLFSYTNPDFPFINTHWLFGVMAFLFNQTIGLESFLILKIIIFLFSVWLVIKHSNSALLLPIGFVFLHVLRERLELRPEIFSFLFTALTYYILQKNLKAPTKLIYFLPVIQLIWINTHIYFFVGLILQAIFLRLHLRGVNVIIFITSVLISLINPNGINGFLYPLNVSTNYGYTIVENQTMFLLESINFRDPNFIWVKISASLVVLSIFLSLVRKKFNLKNSLIASLGLALAMLNVRSFPYLVFLSLPAVLINFGEIKKNQFISFLFFVSCILLLLESFFYLNGDYYRFKDESHKAGLGFEESVKGAMDYVSANNLEPPIYNNFDIGSYIIFRGYPKYQVFVDGRPEAYPKEFFQQNYIPSQSDFAKFKELEDKYGFKTILFSHTDQTPWARSFLQNIVKDESWKLVYLDDFMVVYTKEGTPINLPDLDPNSYSFDNHLSYLRLGLYLLNTGNTDSGVKFIKKTLQLFPQSPIANSILGNPVTNKFFW